MGARFLISSQTLSSSANTVTFSSIPSTYTDLVLRVSIRSGIATTSSDSWVSFNSDTTTNYSKTSISGDGATASSARQSNVSYQYLLDATPGASSTTNTFGSYEMYIPSYTSTSNKPLSVFAANENNTTTAFLLGHAGLYRGASGITSIECRCGSSGLFQVGSTFYLYGISKTN